MKIDAYTKVVLTVIALCLVWQCVNGITPAALAQAQPQPQTAKPQPMPVILVDANGNPLFTPAGLRVTVTNPSLSVDVTNKAIAVAVRAIQRTAVWDPVLVQVLREPPTQMPIP